MYLLIQFVPVKLAGASQLQRGWEPAIEETLVFLKTVSQLVTCFLQCRMMNSSYELATGGTPYNKCWHGYQHLIFRSCKWSLKQTAPYFQSF